MHSVQHASILNFSILSTFTKMVNQLNSVIQNLLQILHNIVLLFEATLPQDVTLLNSINSMNFWHIFDSGSKFEILKPNSSWLTFGISKFVSLSISHFLFLFLQLLFTLCCHIPTLLSFQLLHLKITITLAITSQNYYHFGYFTSKFTFILLYQTQH